MSPLSLTGIARLSLSLLGAAALVSGVVGGVPPASAATPGCTVATATPLDLGVTNQFTTVCPTTRSFSYVDMGAGDTLEIDVDARNLVDSNSYSFFLFNPGVTDFTLTTTPYICYEITSKGQMEHYTCPVFETGRFIIDWKASGTSTSGLAVAPRVTTVARQAGQVPGACRIETAPPAPNGVTQYAQAETCDPTDRWWSINLAAGQRLALATSGVQSAVYLPGITDFTLSQASSWCLSYNTGQYTLDCGVAAQPGTYYIRVFDGRGSLTPTVTNPAPAPTPTPTGGAASIRLWTYSKGSKVELDVDPNAGFEWRVQLQKLVKGQWKAASKVKKTIKTHRKFNPRKGTYRAVVFDLNGYTGAASDPVYVRR